MYGNHQALRHKNLTIREKKFAQLLAMQMPTQYNNRRSCHLMPLCMSIRFPRMSHPPRINSLLRRLHPLQRLPRPPQILHRSFSLTRLHPPCRSPRDTQRLRPLDILDVPVPILLVRCIGRFLHVPLRIAAVAITDKPFPHAGPTRGMCEGREVGI